MLKYNNLIVSLRDPKWYQGELVQRPLGCWMPSSTSFHFLAFFYPTKYSFLHPEIQWENALNFVWEMPAENLDQIISARALSMLFAITIGDIASNLTQQSNSISFSLEKEAFVFSEEKNQCFSICFHRKIESYQIVMTHLSIDCNQKETPFYNLNVDGKKSFQLFERSRIVCTDLYLRIKNQARYGLSLPP